MHHQHLQYIPCTHIHRDISALTRIFNFWSMHDIHTYAALSSRKYPKLLSVFPSTAEGIYATRIASSISHTSSGYNTSLSSACYSYIYIVRMRFPVEFPDRSDENALTAELERERESVTRPEL